MIPIKYLLLAAGQCVVLAGLALTGCAGGSYVSQPGPHTETVFATGFSQIVSLNVNTASGMPFVAATTPGPDTSLGLTATIAAEPAGKFLFVYDTQGAAIDVYSINASTHTLTLVTGSPFPAPGLGAPGGLAVDAVARFLYVTGVFGVDVFAVNGASGALTLVQGSPFADSNGAFGVVTVSPGKFIYTSDIGNGQVATISGFAVNPATGVLAPVPGTPFSTGTNGFPFYLAVHPSGKFLYAGLPFTNAVAAWSIDSSTGALTAIPGFPVALNSTNGSFLSSVVVDPLGKFLYVSDDAGEIFGFSVDSNTGALTAMPGSPFAFLLVNQLFIDASGRFLYSPTGPFLTGFSIDEATGIPTLLPGSPFSVGAQLTIPATLTFVKPAL